MSKNLKKLFSLLLSTILVSSILVSCNSGDKKEGSNSTNNLEETKSTSKVLDSNYMVNADWLSKHLDDSDLIILDARSEKDYSKGHIKGAINVAWQGFSDMSGNSGDENWGVVLPADKLSEKLSAIGVDKNKTIVIYCDTENGWGEDGRFVWMLRMAGLENAKMLDGGFNFWEDNNYPVSKDAVTPIKSNFKVEKLNKETSIDTKELKEKMNTVKILDSRDKSEYEGATKFGEARGGHIPNAINLPFNSVLNKDGTFKTADELEKIFKDAGLNKNDEIVTYCTSGIRSAHLALALNMMGYNNVKNYDASFYAWAKDTSLPINE